MPRPMRIVPKSLPTPVLILLALLAGGGSTQGMVADGLLSAIGGATLVGLLAAHCTGHRPLPPAARPALLLVGALLAIALLQLVPWGANSPVIADDSREGARWAMAQAGVTPRGAISLDPDATWRFALRWLLPVAVFVAAMGSEARERRVAVVVVLVIAMVNAFLAVAQLATLSPALAPWDNTQTYFGGFFANPNHLGLFAAISLLLACARMRERPALLAVYAVTLSVAAVASGSRAALLLLPIGTLMVLAIIVAKGRRRRSVLITGGIVIALAMLFFFTAQKAGYAQPVSEVIAEEDRLTLWPSLVSMAGEAWPWGVGFGAFATAYRAAQPLDVVGPSYLNEAHNLPIQWVIEGGIAGTIWALLALGWIVRKALRRSSTRDGGQWSLFALLALGLVFIHSVVDYPLRTVALASVAALLLALFIDQPAVAPKAKRPALPLLAAIPVGLAAAWFAALPFRAERAVETGNVDAALSMVPNHAAALSTLAEKALVEGAPGAVEHAMQALERSPVRADALRVVFLARSLQGEKVDWQHADKLGWRDAPTQVMAFYDRLGAGDTEKAAMHAQAMLRRRAARPEVISDIRGAAREDLFAKRLLQDAGDRRFLDPLLRLDRNATDDEIAGVLNLARRLDETRLRDLGPIISVLVLKGRFAEARQLYLNSESQRPLFASEEADERIRKLPATPFQWSFPTRPETRVRQANAGLVIEGNVASRGEVAHRLLPLEVGRYKLDANGSISHAGARVTLTISCPDGRTIATMIAERSHSFQPLIFSVDATCPIARLGVEILPADRRFSATLDNFAVSTIP